MGYLAIAVTAIAFVVWYWAVNRLGADTAGLFAGLILVSALLTAAALGTDAISLPETGVRCSVALGSCSAYAVVTSTDDNGPAATPSATPVR